MNFDVPSSPNLYLHRAGRVGRLGAVHAKLGTVVTLVDLQRDPKALEHLSKICATLNGHQVGSSAGKANGSPMQFQRIYVKKGKIFEDVDETHVVRADQVPKLEAFVTREAKAAAAASSGNAPSAAAAGSGAKKERSVRVQATHADHTAAKKRKALALRDADADEATNASDSASDATLLPVDPDERQSAARELSTVFGSEQLDSLKMAELELAAVSTPTKKKQHRSQRPRDPQNQAAAPRAKSRSR